MASPTPHRIALCALARYLGTSNPKCEEDALKIRSPPQKGCVRNLTARDWHALSVLLMQETTPGETLNSHDREPSFRELHAKLDAFSVNKHGAPKAGAIPGVSAGSDPRESNESKGDASLETFLASRKAECFVALAAAPPVNFADLLVEAVGQVVDVDTLRTLIHETEPRSRHAAEMRGELDDGGMYHDDSSDTGKCFPFTTFRLPDCPYNTDTFFFIVSEWRSPVHETSAVGTFLRRCAADFVARSFETTCGLYAGFDLYRRQGFGEFDGPEFRGGVGGANGGTDGANAVTDHGHGGRERMDTKNDRDEHGDVRLKVDASCDAAEAAAEAADASCLARSQRRARMESGGGVAKLEDDDAYDLMGSSYEYASALRSLFTQSGSGSVESFQIVPPADLNRVLRSSLAAPPQSALAKREQTMADRWHLGEVCSSGFGTETSSSSNPSSYLRHLAALQDSDFVRAETELRRHFDYMFVGGVLQDDSEGGVGSGETGLSATGGGTTRGLRFDSTQSRKRLHEGACFPPNTFRLRDCPYSSCEGTVTCAHYPDCLRNTRYERLSRSAFIVSAVLSLAQVHSHAGHAEEALKSLNETVRVAQQSGDVHALANAVAATAVLAASSSNAIASQEGNPGGDGMGASSALSWLNDKTLSKTEPTQAGSKNAAEDHAILLQRLQNTARVLKDPTLLAFAAITHARRRATRPPACGKARNTGHGQGTGHQIHQIESIDASSTRR